MDIQSFILGACAVLVVASVTVGVVAFFKAMNLKKELDDSRNYAFTGIEAANKYRESDVNDLHQALGREIDELHKTIDSRCDKLDNKISNLAKERDKNN